MDGPLQYYKCNPKLNSSLTIIRKRNWVYEAEIYEALLIKKQNPIMNKQLYRYLRMGASLLLNVYWPYLALPIKSYNPSLLIWCYLNLRLYQLYLKSKL